MSLENLEKAIAQKLNEDFEHYVSFDVFKEEVFKFFESELELSYLYDGLYFTQNATILRAQKKLKEEVEKFAEKHKLDPDVLWNNKVVNYVEVFNYGISEVLEESGFEKELAERLAKYLDVGYSDREGGFLVIVNSQVVDLLVEDLLNVDFNSVTQRFLKLLPKESVQRLKKAFSKSEEVFTKTLEEVLTKKEDLLVQAYVETNENLQKFVSAVKDLCDVLASTLLNLSENVAQWISINKPKCSSRCTCKSNLKLSRDL